MTQKKSHTLETQRLLGKNYDKPPFPVDPDHPYYAENSCKVITALETNTQTYFDAINIRNNGAVGNLPDDVILDIPRLAVGGAVRTAAAADSPNSTCSKTVSESITSTGLPVAAGDDLCLRREFVHDVAPRFDRTAVCHDCNNAAIIQHLPTGKSPVLLVLGEDPRPEKFGSFSPDRVFNFSHLASLENERIIFAPEHIQKQMSARVSRVEIMKKVLGRNSVIGDAIIKMKNELREFMRGVYSDFEQAEKSGREPVFEGIRQNQLAVLAGVTPVIVTRALKRDMELKALFDAAKSQRSVQVGAGRHLPSGAMFRKFFRDG